MNNIMKLYTATFITLLILICSGPAYSQVKGISQSRNEQQSLACDIFRELIEINTTVNMGSTKAAEAMAVRLRNAGFPESEINVIGPSPQHMNLVVRYHGKGTQAPILFIGHLDVVEALRQDWSLDPFKFNEIDGYFYGRGTSDMKDDDASLVSNLIRFRQEKFLPERDIIIVLSEDEEGGSDNGIQWLLANRPNLINAEYCINPDGGGGDIKNGLEIIMSIQTSEKVYADFTLETHNKGGHSSLPVKDNAIYRMVAAINRLALYDFPISLNETTRMFFGRNAQNQTGQVKSDMIAVSGIPTDTAVANRLARLASQYNSQMRTTCVATRISGGHANNALPQTVTANINCRLLPDDNMEHVTAVLKNIINDPQIDLKVASAAVAGPASPLRKDVLDAVDKITASMWPGVVVTPVMATGATDGKRLRSAGIPVYGVSGMFGDVDDVRIHGRDERIGVKEFLNGVEFMYRLMKTLSSGSAERK
jgi:acetylornithine deacetylase/succinyl-diaminopimelate desuccinylase-like protein